MVEDDHEGKVHISEIVILPLIYKCAEEIFFISRTFRHECNAHLFPAEMFWIGFPDNFLLSFHGH